MFDAVVKNGSVIDGTGAPARVAGIGIRDGRVVAVGDLGESGQVVIDADGLTVAPGFIDLHSHYDAQVFWDTDAHPVVPPRRDDRRRRQLRSHAGPGRAWPIRTSSPGCSPGSRPSRWRRSWRASSSGGARSPSSSTPSTPAPWPQHRVHGRAIRPSDARSWAPPRRSAPRRPTSSPRCARCSTRPSPPVASGSRRPTSATQVDGDGRPTPPNFATRDEFVELLAVCGDHGGTSIEFIPGSFLRGFSDDDDRPHGATCPPPPTATSTGTPR